MSELDGKVVVVTGGAVGLGRELARQLAAAGARVAILGRTAEALRQTADEIGPSVLAVPADIASGDQVRAAFAAIDKQWGDAHILINNAAVYDPYRIDEATDEQLQATFQINVVGAAFCIREALPGMRRRGLGDIVNITSESVRNPFPFLTAYAASKSALETLSLGLRSELRGENIRVTVLRTGSMSGENANVARRWPAELTARLIAAFQASGHAAYTGAGMAPESVARTVLAALTAPRDANLDLIEVRAI